LKKLPIAPKQYDEKDQIVLRQTLEAGDRENVKTGQDIEVGSARLILTSPNGTRYSVTVNDAGTLGAALA
jgi:hypothetical protein